MQHITKNSSRLPAIFAGGLGLLLASTSLAHNIQGVWPRVTATPGTAEFFNQIMTEGGATVGLNLVALFALAIASLIAARGFRGKAALLSIAAVMAILWSGTTQLGVIAEKTFHVSGNNETAADQFNRALAREKELKAARPLNAKSIGQAEADLNAAKAALRSHRYGTATAWDTTEQCTGSITAAASKRLCRQFQAAKMAHATALNAARIVDELKDVQATIAKGPPGVIDGGPEMIAAASGGLLSVKTVQIILVFLRSYGIDLAAGVLISSAVILWSTPVALQMPTQHPRYGSQQQPREVAHQLPAGGNGGQKQLKRVQREHTQRLIENMQAGVQNHKAVLNTLNTLAGGDGGFKTTYRAIASHAGIATGAVNDALTALEAVGLIERYSSKGRGTMGRVLQNAHAYA